ncbi:DUF421 domain-containing protein [Cytophagaceae bacterium DM2B3-1]|uniref:DUF421 domain-containing protein n=1 Tax=Xanthocytophaga flava TaxID=3048013 RepID=A0ABT7CIH9_9BACT|nr:YetF domain-containing protein [Xanthocytophaga flavus]MDJ1469564.1 DUF421 domain-containing protein [Xanthocytophaga flavus]MDJ1493510.1 DUF421 domain-containing protein [Xanthocytophaga flavus]
MKKEDIHLWDIQRILLGDAPVVFLVEVFLRSVFIFLFLLVIVRLLGKRMNAQLSLTEMSIMIMLGAIVSAPMQDPIRGLLPGVVILLCVFVALRGVNRLSVAYAKVERLVQGDVRLFVKNGVLQLNQIRQEGFEREQIFAHLRSKKITHLGQLSRVYLEACGIVSIYHSDKPKPGLSLLPFTDQVIVDRQSSSDALLACHSCGWVIREKDTDQQVSCPNCQANSWTKALITEVPPSKDGSPVFEEANEDSQKIIFSSYKH